MNSLFNKHRWLQVLWGILLFVAGVITIIFAVTNKGENVNTALSVAIAIVLFSYGLTIVFSSFLELREGFFKYEILIGAFVIATGIVFCMNVDFIKDVIVSLISASLLTFGAVFAIRAILGFVFKLKVWWKPLCIVFAVLFIAAGVLCLVFKDDVINVCYIIFGGIIAVVGVIEIYFSIKLAIEASRSGIENKSKAKKDVVEEAEVTNGETTNENPVIEIENK